VPTIWYRLYRGGSVDPDGAVVTKRGLPCERTGGLAKGSPLRRQVPVPQS
jgi:hypothetical protein